MSQENVELVYQGFDAWNRRDLDAALAGSHPDVEATPVRGPAATTYRGHEGIRQFWSDIFGTFPDFSTEVVEARDLGDFVVGSSHSRPGNRQRSVVRTDGLVRKRVARRKAALVLRLRKRNRRPRSHPAAGVSDVAGQPGVRQAGGSGASQASRTLDGRLALRFPRLAHTYGRLIYRLPPSSRLRQAVVWRAARLGIEAFNRRDFDLWPGLVFEPDCEFHPPREWIDAGLVEPSYRGPGGYRNFVSSWSDVWGPDFRVEEPEVIDLGRRLVLLYDISVRGQASGVPLTMKWAAVARLKNGRTTRECDYLHHAEALEAVGLRE